MADDEELYTVHVLGADTARIRLNAIREGFEQAPKAVMHDAALVMRAALQREAPRRTGAFAKSLGFRVADEANMSVATFTAASPLAKYIIDGTKPHVIFPSKKKALYWPGAAHPVGVVHHPGTRPNDFVSRAYEFAKPAIQGLLDSTGEGILAGGVRA